MIFSDTAIVTDLDGTFFNSEAELVGRNLDAVEYYKKNGGLFAVATGRVHTNMGLLNEIMPTLVNIPCIQANGAYAYDYQKKKTYNEIFLNTEKASEYVKLVTEAFPKVSARVSTRDGKYILHDTEWNEFDDRIIGHLPVDEVPRNGWYRVAFDGPCEMLDAARERFEKNFREYFDFVKSCDTIYEFNDKTATKGTALDRLRELLIKSGRATDKLKIYAAGDFENDLDMLRHADVPCCPENAIDRVKAIAKMRVCRCDDGAIADIIENIEKERA